MSSTNEPLSTETVRRLLQMLEPGSTLLSIQELPGSFSNATHKVVAKTITGTPVSFVARRYAVFGNYDLSQKARREFKTYQLLRKHDIPAPEPLILDDTGGILGTPGIVTTYVLGKLVLAPPYPENWSRELARTLAHIHSIPCDNADFLLDAHQEAAWFMNSTMGVPDYMSAHSEGLRIWDSLHRSQLETVSPGLIHLDYWAGNILWASDSISAVLDWEEAACGDPAIDVAYCRMDTMLSGNSESAREFLNIYENEVGRRISNLGYWELAAAVRPMFNQARRISEPIAQERFLDFINQAYRHL